MHVVIPTSTAQSIFSFHRAQPLRPQASSAYAHLYAWAEIHLRVLHGRLARLNRINVSWNQPPERLLISRMICIGDGTMTILPLECW